jgi:hypothetical protein
VTVSASGAPGSGGSFTCYGKTYSTPYFMGSGSSVGWTLAPITGNGEQTNMRCTYVGNTGNTGNTYPITFTASESAHSSSTSTNVTLIVTAPTTAPTATFNATVWNSAARNVVWTGYKGNTGATFQNDAGPNIVVPAGFPFALNWTSANATACTIDGAAANPVAGGNINTYTAGGGGWTHTYTLNCTGTGAPAVKTITVSAPPDPTNVTAVADGCGANGNALTLQWTRAPGYGYSYVRIQDTTGVYQGLDDYNGAIPVVFTTVPGRIYNYWIHTDDFASTGGPWSGAPGGSITCNNPAPTAIPTVSCSVSPNPVPNGGNPGITLSSTSTTGFCYLYHDWNLINPTNLNPGTFYPGAQTVPGNHEGEAICYSADWSKDSGWSYCNYTVNAPAPTASLTVNTAYGSASNGGSVTTYGYSDTPTLTWSSTNAASCTVTSNNSDNKSGTSGTNVAANTLGNDSGSGHTFTYTLNCTGAGGSASQHVNVVVPPWPTNIVTTTPGCGASGNSLTMTWDLPSGYSTSYVRIYDSTSALYLYMSDQTYNTTSWTGTTVPGHQYTTWFHTSVPSGAYSMANGWLPITCNTTPTGSGPLTVTLLNGTCGQADLYWDAVAGATGYNVYRNTVDDSVNGVTQVGSNVAQGTPASHYRDTTVAPGGTYFYWVTGIVSGFDSVKTQSSPKSVGITQCTGNLFPSDKEIVAVNGTNITPAPTSCNQVSAPLPSYTTVKTGDVLSFSVNLCNSGNSTTSSISVTDSLTDLKMPTGINPKTGSSYTDFYAKYCNGGSCLSLTPMSPITSCPASAGKYCVTGTVPGQQIIFNLAASQYNIPAPIAPQTVISRNLTFDAQLDVPAGFSGLSPRFQNKADVGYFDGSTNTSNSPFFTPLQMFTNGNIAPIIQERP